jgi:L,D-transpeptidase YcbB
MPITVKYDFRHALKIFPLWIPTNQGIIRKSTHFLTYIIGDTSKTFYLASMKYLVSFLLIILSAATGWCQSEAVRQVLSSPTAPLYVDGIRLLLPDQVQQFYRQRNYQLAWSIPTHRQAILDRLKEARHEGFHPTDLHLLAIASHWDYGYGTALDTAFLDVFITDALLHYGARQLTGLVTAHRLSSGAGFHTPPLPDLPAQLADALSWPGIDSLLEQWTPAYSGYAKLKEVLQFYSRLAVLGGWPQVAEGPTLRLGDTDDRVATLRRRLFVEGYYPNSLTLDNTHYDSLLLEAVMRYQHRNGMVGDGAVGARTLERLNEPVEQVVEKIVVNLERWRWMGTTEAALHIRVNIPDFTLVVAQKDSVYLAMRTIVGRPTRSTPLLASEVRYITLNPTWTIPPTILREDFLPAVKRDIGYLAKNKLRILTRSGEEVDPHSLDWAGFTAQNFPYTVRQDPGEYNSLGLIKFSFPNDYTVFLHDTNHRALFRNANRALSSGCVRVEHPFALAELLLGGADRIKRAMDSKTTETILLRQGVPIRLVYFTAFVNAEGEFEQRPDIYQLDKNLWNLIHTH